MKLVNIEKGFVYCLENKEYGICRIGKTISKDGSRQKQQVAYLPFEVEVITIAVDNHTYAESLIHKKFAEYRSKADWFKVTSDMFRLEMVNVIDEVNLAIAETMNYHDKHSHDVFITQNFPMMPKSQLHKCEYCGYSNYDKYTFGIHEMTCVNSPKGHDACIGCINCERFDKTIVKTYKSAKKEPRIIKSHGFLCKKKEQKMFPRLVIRNGIHNSLPDSAFEGEILMPYECEHYEDGLQVRPKLKQLKL